MRMQAYKPARMKKTTLRVNKSIEGERIEEKINRILNNSEPITDSAPQIFTERKEGVIPQLDIRTDKWEYMAEAMNAKAEAHQAQRAENLKKFDEKLTKDNQDLNKGEKGGDKGKEGSKGDGGTPAGGESKA